MRILKKSTLRDFWEEYPDAEAGLKMWYSKVKKAEFKTPLEVITNFKDSDYVGNRIVFNIARNKYRLIASFRYDKQICRIHFVGNHKQYDKIDPKTIYIKISNTMENFALKAIKTKEQYQEVMNQIDELWECPENSPEADLLEVLSILADDYENKTSPILPLEPIQAIKYEMEENGLAAKDLIPFLGSRSKVSEVLNYKRPLTFTMAKKLYLGLNIPAESFFAF